jgi:hypothetical protein
MKIKQTFSDVASIVVIILIVLAMIIAISLVTMWLWNWLMPEIFLCDKINLLQAVGLLALVSLLTSDKQKLFGWLYE